MGLDSLPILPTSVVGSHGLPGWAHLVRQASEGLTLGAIDVREIGDDLVRLAILDQDRAGVDVITDGELRRTAGYYRGYMDRIENLPKANRPPLRTLGPDHYDFIGFREVVGPIAAPDGLGITEEFRFLKENTGKPTKVTCAGP